MRSKTSLRLKSFEETFAYNNTTGNHQTSKRFAYSIPALSGVIYLHDGNVTFAPIRTRVRKQSSATHFSDIIERQRSCARIHVMIHRRKCRGSVPSHSIRKRRRRFMCSRQTKAKICRLGMLMYHFRDERGGVTDDGWI